MPRTARLEYPRACYHVINRGNYRSDIFSTDGARTAFERTMFQACEQSGWRLHAFVIMRNHFHMAMETPEPNLSESMKWLQGTWVCRFNRLRKIKGRPFQGRFKSLLVQPGHALAEVGHYIHLNPVRAKIITPPELPSFRWSSLDHGASRNGAARDCQSICSPLQTCSTGPNAARETHFVKNQAMSSLSAPVGSRSVSEWGSPRLSVNMFAASDLLNRTKRGA